MSRIGKSPVQIPEKVSVDINGLIVTVKGPKGELKRLMPEGVNFVQEENQIIVTPSTTKRYSIERHGLCRTLISNMVQGVTDGYSKKLEIVGVGSRAQVKGKTLVVSAGYSHPVEMTPPDGITYKVESNTNVIVSGIDKEIVGNEAAKF